MFLSLDLKAQCGVSKHPWLSSDSLQHYWHWRIQPQAKARYAPLMRKSSYSNAYTTLYAWWIQIGSGILLCVAIPMQSQIRECVLTDSNKEITSCLVYWYRCRLCPFKRFRLCTSRSLRRFCSEHQYNTYSRIIKQWDD
jgi:hypothetical protein